MSGEWAAKHTPCAWSDLLLTREEKAQQIAGLVLRIPAPNSATSLRNLVDNMEDSKVY